MAELDALRRELKQRVRHARAQGMPDEEAHAAAFVRAGLPIDLIEVDEEGFVRTSRADLRITREELLSL